ncbi:F0F1 ATP synthase subunit alpha [Patescibacteria group bacterium]|nr:F0F1 ATP synthase subunit alpha [Patescibacteria group bacterium]
MSLIDTYKQQFTDYMHKNQEIGFIEKVHHPVAYVKGLPGVILSEVVYFESGCMGLVTGLSTEHVEILTFTNDAVRVGEKVSRSGEILKVPVGEGLLGEIINPIGNSMYQNKVITGLEEKRGIFANPLPINMRERINKPLETGVPMVDMLVPIGRGQRELIIGDRNTGKTTFVFQSILYQAKIGTICIYAGIAKKKHSLKKAEQLFDKHGIRGNTIIVGSASSDPIANIYLTPYTAMTIAEYFRDKGKDVLLILDDLSAHAKYYREVSLLSRKFPGRDSYPGDIFYAHARLLERAGNFNINGNISSITCLPVAASIEGDITGYIQTNLMSITDGHIFFDYAVFKAGKRPAINHFLSVTRVGRQTQTPIRWGVNRELSTFLYLHSKTERFIHFGAEINEGIRATIDMGKKIDQLFDQETEETYSMDVQIIIFVLVWTGILKDETSGKIKFYKMKAQDLYDNDESFREKIVNLVSNSNDFNTLLGKVSANHKELMEYMEENVS